MIKRDDGDGRDGILDSGPEVSNIDTIVTTVTESLGEVQGALFKGRPCWGCCPWTAGQSPSRLRRITTP